MNEHTFEKYGFRYYQYTIVKINPDTFNYYYNKTCRGIFLDYDRKTQHILIYHPIKPDSFILGDIDTVIFKGYVKTRQQFECLLEMLEINYNESENQEKAIKETK